MPYGWIDPEVFVKHCGVTVYHVYKDDEFDAGKRTYIFTTDLNGRDGDDPNAFDVRDLSNFDYNKPPKQVVREAIERGEVMAPAPSERRISLTQILK